MVEGGGARKKQITWLKYLIGISILLAGYFFYNSFEIKVKTIGIARWGKNAEFAKSVDGFIFGLKKQGFEVGKNLKIIVKNSEGNTEKQKEIISSFIDSKVDLIFTLTTPGTIIAKELTGEMTTPIPVVFSVCTYPVESNLVHSLDNSQNNLVGTRNYVPFSRQYYQFDRVFPHTKTLAVVRRKGEPNSTNQFEEIKKTLARQGINVLDIAATNLEEINSLLIKNLDKFDTIYSTCDTLTHNGGEEYIIRVSKKYNKPSFSCNKEGVIKGHLLGNIGDFESIGKISGEKAALILNGSKPSWLKTESPREDYLVINKKTAKFFNFEISQEVSREAKEIFE